MDMPVHIVAVGGLVRDGRGNVLIGRSIWRKQWEFFGGQVENGENLEEALTREILEETGIVASVGSLAGVYSNTGSRYTDQGVYIPTKVMFDFLCDYIGGTPRNSEETERVMWVPAAKAVELIDTDPYRMRLENLLNYNGTVAYHAYTTHPFIERHHRFF